ncbi:MAG: polysulfide reductase NrfD, partial [Eggerthellaceae bacterium]|nr:polysulfide reductase NrfD [Eggerthellaceae bacterium]
MEMLQTEWGWQIAVYLFLGGLAAGALFVMDLINVRRPGKFAKAT